MHTCIQAEGLDDQDFADGNMSHMDAMIHVIAKAESLNVCKHVSMNDRIVLCVYAIVCIQAAKDDAGEEDADTQNAQEENETGV